MIEIYTTGDKCQYCVLAKRLLESKNIPFKEHIIGIHILKENFTELFPTARTVPQIVDDGIRVGGYEDLVGYLEEQQDPGTELLQG